MSDTLTLEVHHNFKQYRDNAYKLEKEILNNISSKAAQEAATLAAEFTRQEGKRSLEKPIPAIFDTKGGKHRRGWIWFEWDTPAVVKKSGQTNAMLQLQGLGNAAVRLKQQEILHRQIYGTVEKEGVTPKVPFIIRPSRMLKTNKRIPKVPFWSLDQHGNIKNYRGTMKKSVNDKFGRFFQVKLGERGGGKYNNGISLPPGLYFRITRKRRYKKHPITKHKGPYNRKPKNRNKVIGARGRETVGITTVLTYHRIRDYKRAWRFKETTGPYMQRAYNRSFLRLFNAAIRAEKRATQLRKVT